MKITIQRARLFDGIRKVLPGANAKTAMPILANVKLEASDGKLKMTTTSLDLTLSTVVDCTVEESGITTVPIRMLNSIVSAMAECDVEMTLNGDKMRIRGGKYVSQVGVMNPTNFPKISEDAAECSFKMPVTKIKDLLRKTAYAKSTDDTRRTLYSVLFELSKNQFRSVATDGRRMVIAETEGAYDGESTLQYIIPAMTVNNIQKFLEGDGDIVIEANKKQIRFITNDGKDKIVSGLVEGVYPDYIKVVPVNNDKLVFVDRNELIGAVERVSVMATRDDSSIKMTIADNRMIVEVKGDDLCDAHDEIPVKYEGAKIEIIFNPHYILDYLKASDSDEIKMEFMDGLHAANFKSSTEHYICTLMPLRTSNV